jgi:thioredoxin 1
LVQRFRLSGIPTILIFKDGEVARKITGFHSKEALDKIIICYLRNDFYVKENIKK